LTDYIEAVGDCHIIIRYMLCPTVELVTGQGNLKTKPTGLVIGHTDRSLLIMQL